MWYDTYLATETDGQMRTFVYYFMRLRKGDSKKARNLTRVRGESATRAPTCIFTSQASTMPSECWYIILYRMSSSARFKHESHLSSNNITR